MQKSFRIPIKGGVRARVNSLITVGNLSILREILSLLLHHYCARPCYSSFSLSCSGNLSELSDTPQHQSLTSQRHSGNGSANATRNNTNAKDQTIVAKASKASSEYHTMEALCGGPEYTDTVGCRAATYSTSSGTKSVSSSEKQLVSKGEYKRTQQVQPSPTEGLISRSCTRYIKDQVKVYL
jgi:hypothetical protein